jgi:Ca-activated chloride channel family protein
VSFGAPLLLLFLLAVPAAIAAHVVALRRRRRYPIRFPALATLQAVMPREPVWRRHLPIGLLCAAIAALGFALARPQRSVAVAEEQASVVLVTDVSRSMSASDVSPTRLKAAQNAAETFLDKVPSEVRVGLVSFSDVAQTLQSPTTDHDGVRRALSTLEPLLGTSTGAGLNAALQSLQLPDDPAAKHPPAAIVLLSDGKATDGSSSNDAATQAGRLHVPIYTVALGTDEGTIESPSRFGGVITTPVPPDPEALKRIADESGGVAFRAEDSDQLSSVYEGLGSQLGSKREQQEITVLFVGGALLLLGGAVFTSVRRGGRLP